jgi:hypothetical protein
MARATTIAATCSEGTSLAVTGFGNGGSGGEELGESRTGWRDWRGLAACEVENGDSCDIGGRGAHEGDEYEE